MTQSVRTENTKIGTTTWKILNPALYGEIEGYASEVSVDLGGSITFFVSTRAPSFDLEIYRMGWYQGLGARLIDSVIGLQGSLQRKHPGNTP